MLETCPYLCNLVLRQVVQQRLQPAPQELLRYLLAGILKAPIELRQTGHVVRRCSGRAPLVTVALCLALIRPHCPEYMPTE